MEMRKRLITVMVPFVFAVTAAGAAAAPAAKEKPQSMKCWTNKEGTRECGNSVPPEYAQQETRELNARGMTVDVKERAKTPEELAAEERARQEEETRQADALKSRKERERHDQMLLQVYTSVRDIEKMRDQRLAAVKSNAELTESNIESLKRKLEEERRRAAELERRGKPLPDDLKNAMADLERQLREKEDYVASKQREQEEIKVRAAEDIKRFTELMEDKEKREKGETGKPL